MSKTMLDVAEVRDALVALYPEFWRDYQASSAYDPDLPYTQLCHLASHLVELIRTGDIGQFERLFQTVENRLIDAPRTVRDLLIVGFLEDLQNMSLNASMPLDRWEPWLGPTSFEAWRILIAFWNGKLRPGEFNRYIESGKLPSTSTFDSTTLQILRRLLARLRGSHRGA